MAGEDFFDRTLQISLFYAIIIEYVIHAPIAQGIEHRSPEPGAKVRILLGAP